MRFLAANNSNWKIEHTHHLIVNKQEKIHYIKANIKYLMSVFIMETNTRTKQDCKVLYTLIKYAELVWGSPFEWPIYKIRAGLHVKEVKNYSMKQVHADCVRKDKCISNIYRDGINFKQFSMTLQNQKETKEK